MSSVARLTLSAGLLYSHAATILCVANLLSRAIVLSCVNVRATISRALMEIFSEFALLSRAPTPEIFGFSPLLSRALSDIQLSPRSHEPLSRAPLNPSGHPTCLHCSHEHPPSPCVISFSALLSRHHPSLCLRVLVLLLDFLILWIFFVSRGGL